MDTQQRRRYARQIAIEGFGREAQEKLLNAKVGIIGCGALGSMVAMQLAGAGVGHLVIADFDTVDISNLQRQYFFETSQAGGSKAAILGERIHALNPEVRVTVHNLLVTERNAATLLEGCGFLVDATDNPASKTAVEAIALKCGTGCCIAGISEFHGQVMTVLPGSPRFADLFGEGADAGFTPCSTGGVAGPAAAFCASVQACETIKHLTGLGDTLAGQVLVFDLLANRFDRFTISRSASTCAQP